MAGDGGGPLEEHQWLTHTIYSSSHRNCYDGGVWGIFSATKKTDLKKTDFGPRNVHVIFPKLFHFTIIETHKWLNMFLCLFVVVFWLKKPTERCVNIPQNVLSNRNEVRATTKILLNMKTTKKNKQFTCTRWRQILWRWQASVAHSAGKPHHFHTYCDGFKLDKLTERRWRDV